MWFAPCPGSPRAQWRPHRAGGVFWGYIVFTPDAMVSIADCVLPNYAFQECVEAALRVAFGPLLFGGLGWRRRGAAVPPSWVVIRLC